MLHLLCMNCCRNTVFVLAEADDFSIFRLEYVKLIFWQQKQRWKMKNSEECLFCRIKSDKDKILLQNELCFAIADANPVTPGHTLVIPYRHEADYFALSVAEQQAIHEVLQVRRRQLLESDPTIVGLNVGINVGEAAGQTVFHVHVHLIPRRRGDVEEPRGGVRGVIPARQKY